MNIDLKLLKRFNKYYQFLQALIKKPSTDCDGKRSKYEMEKPIDKL